MSQTPFTPAERIRELSAINAEVPAMLASAGRAVSALTNRVPNGEDNETNGTSNGEQRASVVAHKQMFTDAAKAYVVGLQAICARLRRQAYALEEAGVIAAEAPMLGLKKQSDQAGPAAATSAATQRQEKLDDGITNGGLGNLDVGLLNSRGNSVGVQKEAELIAKAKLLLKNMQTRQEQTQQEQSHGEYPHDEDKDDNMEEA